MDKQSAESVISKIPIIRIMHLIDKDPNFGYMNVEVTVSEIEKDKHYQYNFHFKDTPEKDFSEDVFPQTIEEIRELRNMKKKPQNIYSVLVSQKTINEEGKEVLTSNVLVNYEKGSHLQGVLDLTTAIVARYMEFKGIETAEELNKMILTNDMEEEKEFQMHQKLLEKFGRRF